MPKATTIQLRTDTYANWSLANKVLLAGEMALESDTGRIKVGDGVTTYTSLGYFFLKSPRGLPSYTVALAPTASSWEGHEIYVTDETGGAVPAFSDGTNWRRVTDRTIISA